MENRLCQRAKNDVFTTHWTSVFKRSRKWRLWAVPVPGRPPQQDRPRLSRLRDLRSSRRGAGLLARRRPGA